jgi:hypothetical protein
LNGIISGRMHKRSFASSWITSIHSFMHNNNLLDRYRLECTSNVVNVVQRTDQNLCCLKSTTVPSREFFLEMLSGRGGPCTCKESLEVV